MFGHQLVIGIQGKILDAGLKAFLEEIRPGGIIFFTRNIASSDQFKKLISDIRNLLGEEVFFAIDHEGGTVQRLTDGVTSFPGNQALGKTGREDKAYEQGQVMAQELRAFGLNVNFAPVLDVGTGPRSFGNDPALVSKLGRAFIRGLQDHGVAATAKHFPGMGASTLDPHEDLPTVSLAKEAMEGIHLRPFEAVVRAGVQFVMTSHIIYRAFDEKSPATFSRKIVREILRENLSFQNIILTDDMEMGAIARHFPWNEAVVRALEAGHDMILVCHDEAKIREACGALSSAYREGRLLAGDGEESRARVSDVLRKLGRMSRF